MTTVARSPATVISQPGRAGVIRYRLQLPAVVTQQAQRVVSFPWAGATQTGPGLVEQLTGISWINVGGVVIGSLLVLLALAAAMGDMRAAALAAAEPIAAAAGQPGLAAVAGAAQAAAGKG